MEDAEARVLLDLIRKSKSNPMPGSEGFYGGHIRGIGAGDFRTTGLPCSAPSLSLHASGPKAMRVKMP